MVECAVRVGAAEADRQVNKMEPHLTKRCIFSTLLPSLAVIYRKATPTVQSCISLHVNTVAVVHFPNLKYLIFSQCCRSRG